MKRNQQNQAPLAVYCVEETNAESGEGYWTKIGAAFAHKDGHGFSIVLNALPLNGKLVLREPKVDEGAGR